MDERIKWAGYSWLTKLHREPRYLDPIRKFWADQSAVSIDSNGYLHLKTHLNPKQFPTGKPLIGAGLIASDKTFSYGNFEIQLPKGKHLWPAFWCIGGKDWPPEVDIFEGYSDKKGSYRDFKWYMPFSPWDIETNAWYGTADHPKQLGAKRTNKVRGDPSSRFEYYRLEWTPKRMQIFFGRDMVRRIEDRVILDRFKDQGLIIVLNNAVTNAATNLESHQSTDFVVKYFSYKPI